jgi:HEAT repeat protein
MCEDVVIITLCKILHNDTDCQNRSNAAEVLGNIVGIKDKEAILSLCNSAETDDDPDVRRCAIGAIGKIYGPRVDELNTFIDLIKRTFLVSESSRINIIGNVSNINITENALGGQDFTQTINNPAPQNLAESAAEIQQLLEQLAQSNSAILGEQDQAVEFETLHQELNRNPTLKSRLLSALRAGGTEALTIALEAVFQNPLIAIPVETIKGWIEAE